MRYLNIALEDSLHRFAFVVSILHKVVETGLPTFSQL